MLTDEQLHISFEAWLQSGGTTFLERLTKPDRELLFKTWRACHYFTLIAEKEGFEKALAAGPQGSL